MTTTHTLTLTEREANALLFTGPLVTDRQRGIVDVECAALALPLAGWQPVAPEMGEALAFVSPRLPGRLAFDRRGVSRSRCITGQGVAALLCAVEAQIVASFIEMDAAGEMLLV